MNYELKDKISVTRELLAELETKSWQEIEYLQAQISNLSEGPVNNKLRQLFKNLLTSYYVFTGGVEALVSEPIDNTIITSNVEQEPKSQKIEIESEPYMCELENITPEDDFSTKNLNSDDIAEPFEYFVDFDDPIGEPLTDKDLYNN